MTKSDTEKVADEILANAMKEMSQTQSTANKLLRAKMISIESQKTLQKVRELSDDYDDEEDEEDERPQDLGEEIVGGLVKKFLGNMSPNQTKNLEPLIEKAKSLTPEQLEKIKQKFLE